jgi:hypothetical protein
MFPFPIAKPQGCDIQTFYGITGASDAGRYSWNKPVGVSHVYMMLIGGGATGDGTNGGGSGAVTVWYGAAQHVPNRLEVLASRSGATSNVSYRGASLVTLLSANGGNAPTGGTATTAGPFAASGFYKSTAGQDGSSGTVSASTTTFLAGGGNESIANYGYSSVDNGFFMMQPIIVGVGAGDTKNGGIGCGGGNSPAGSHLGGAGMVLIASW